MTNRSGHEHSILELMHSKVVDFSEIVICLFEHCNLQCVFCPQDHSSIIGASRNEILKKVSPIVHYIRDNKSRDFHLHVMGGELFQDVWIRQGFLKHYEDFLIAIKESTESNKNLHFNFISNLVFDESKEVLNFLKRNDLKISISYDPSGRFNQEQLDIFRKNLDIFKDHIRMASIVITRQNIEKVKNGDVLFDHIYQNFPIDWDQLLPAFPGSSRLMPKESELLELHKLLLDRYPECINLESYTTPKAENKMRCTRGNSMTIMPDGSIPKGCSGALFLKEAKTDDLGSDKIIERFVNKYDCFTCAYYSRCPFTCFIKQDYKHLVEDLDQCVYKATFSYAEGISHAHQ